MRQHDIPKSFLGQMKNIETGSFQKNQPKEKLFFRRTPTEMLGTI